MAVEINIDGDNVLIILNYTINIATQQYYYRGSDGVSESISQPAYSNIHLSSPSTPSSLSFQRSQRSKSKTTIHQKPIKSACTTVSAGKFYRRIHYSIFKSGRLDDCCEQFTAVGISTASSWKWKKWAELLQYQLRNNIYCKNWCPAKIYLYTGHCLWILWIASEFSEFFWIYFAMVNRVLIIEFAH